MLFYLYKSLPKCVLDFKTIEACILDRFQLYSLPETSQHDTKESNHFDNISHLFMSIIVIDYPRFKDSFIQGEVKIFRKKLEHQKSTDISKALSEISEYLDTMSQSEEFRIIKSVWSKQFCLIKNIIKVISSKSSHSFKESHKKTCRKYKLTLPFTFLLKLVAERKVNIIGGKVSLSCGHWNEVLEVIFEFLLNIELALLEKSEDIKIIFESEDDRFRQIIRRFTNFLNGNLNEEKRTVTGHQLDENSRYFPPCMANLHQILRQTHRLSYDSRYQYSLFLKDIGLPIEDNILFWENEYKKPHCGSACTHYWKDNEKRYRYQIEHMYGFIGTRDLKTSHSCEKFIKDLQSKMDGGCPFQHLSVKQLQNSLPKCFEALPDLEDIFIYKNNGLPQRACAAYLNCLQKVLAKERNQEANDFSKWLQIVSPVQFYNIAVNL